MSAAVEGALENIPSIGFSLGSYAIDADFSTAQIFAEQIIKKVIDNQFPAHTCLNVNIPNLTVNEIAGIKVCRQAQSIWEEDFDERIDPYGRKYYWMTGKMNVYDVGKDTDEQALSENFVSIVPVQFDLTAHQHITTVNNWFNEN
jgi:5'-nucleotidase